MYARFGFVGSTTIPDTNRCGAADDVLSIRVKVTAEAVGLSAFCETNTRPVDVAAQRVLWFAFVRAIAATTPPDLSVPYAPDVRSWFVPSATKSPQPGCANDVENSGQFASRYALLPPKSCVRQMLCRPTKNVPETTGSPICGL